MIYQFIINLDVYLMKTQNILKIQTQILLIALIDWSNNFMIK